MKQILCQAFDMPFAALALGGAGAGALTVAMIAEHVFGILPCILCYWERVPYALAILCGLGAYAARGRRCVAGMLLVLAFLGFVAGTGISFFHTGVEQHWWQGTDECEVQPMGDAASVADLKAALLAQPAVRCDEISWSLFGLTLANMNVLASLVLAAYVAMVLRKMGRMPGTSCGAGCLCHKNDP